MRKTLLQTLCSMVIVVKMLMLELDLMIMETEMSDFGIIQKEIIKSLIQTTTIMLLYMDVMTGSSPTLEKFGFYRELQDLVNNTLIMLENSLRRKLEKTLVSKIIIILTDGLKHNKVDGANTTLARKGHRDLNSKELLIEWFIFNRYNYSLRI